jgi:hypothetical protein
MIEAMEPRRLMAVTAVSEVTMTGSAGQILGVVLTFRVPLDPASAQNVNAYSISKKTKGEDSSFGPIDTSTDGTTRRVRFSAAVYDSAAQTVTLTPTEPFDLARKFKRLRVSGNGPNAVKAPTGAPIDGDGNGKPGGNAEVHSRVVRASHFNFKEPDGDTARLRLSGPGTLRVWSDKKRIISPVVFLFGTNPGQSTLTGTVHRNRRHGDGIVTIGEISQTTLASVPLLTDPAFRVEVVNP